MDIPRRQREARKKEIHDKVGSHLYLKIALFTTLKEN